MPVTLDPLAYVTAYVWPSQAAEINDTLSAIIAIYLLDITGSASTLLVGKWAG